eukprot:gene6205-7188_t
MVVASDAVHVVPHALVQSVIDGDKPSSILTEPVVKRIIEEWLQQVLEFKREDWRDAAKTLRKIADDLDAGEHPECTVGALTLIGAKGEVTVFGLGPKCDDLQCLGAMRLGEQKLMDVLLDNAEG